MSTIVQCIQVSGNFRFAFFLIYLGWPRCDADADADEPMSEYDRMSELMID